MNNVGTTVNSGASNSGVSGEKQQNAPRGRLILFRHGQTTSNLITALDTAVPGADLTSMGVEQAFTGGERIVADGTLSGVGEVQEGDAPPGSPRPEDRPVCRARDGEPGRVGVYRVAVDRWCEDRSHHGGAG
ncbi:histidine phosphatase family protein [Corynebacterium sp. c7Ub_26]